MKKNLCCGFFAMLLLAAALLFVGCGEKEAPERGIADTAAEETAAKEAPPLTGVTVCIDAGHGLSTDSGEEPIAPNGEQTRKKHSTGTEGQTLTEEELNLSVALLAQELLIAEGADVVMTRTTHECDMSNIDRAEFATENGADLTVRIHADGSENTATHGISVLIPAADYIEDEELLARSAVLGDLLLNEAVAATGADDRGVVQRSDLTGFNWSKVPVALIEMGFMSNPQEDALLSEEEYQRKLAQAIAGAVAAYIEIYPVEE